MKKLFTIHYSLFAILRNPERVALHLLTICYLLFTNHVYASPFLKLPASAKGLSLVGSYVAGESIGVVEYNPSGLLQLRGFNAEFGYMRYFEDVVINSFYGGYCSRKVGVAVGYKGYSVLDVARNTVGMPQGKIEHSESVISGVFSVKLTRNFQAGITLKSISRNISDGSPGGINTKLSGVAFDTGIVFSRGDNHYGISVVNLGGDLKFDYAGAVVEKLPLSYNVGARHTIGRFVGYWRVSQFDSNKRTLVSTAIEYYVSEFLSLRGGIKYQRYFDVSCGFGIRWNRFYLDYALSPHMDFGLTHNISLGVRF